MLLYSYHVMSSCFVVFCCTRILINYYVCWLVLINKSIWELLHLVTCFETFYCTLNAIIYMHMCSVNIYKFVECSFSISPLQNWVRNSFKIDKGQCNFVIYMLKKIDSIALLKMVVQRCHGMETPSTRVSRATTPSQSPTRSVKHQPKSRRSTCTQPNTDFDGMCGSNRPFFGDFRIDLF